MSSPWQQSPGPIDLSSKGSIDLRRAADVPQWVLIGGNHGVRHPWGTWVLGVEDENNAAHEWLLVFAGLFLGKKQDLLCGKCHLCPEDCYFGHEKTLSCSPYDVLPWVLPVPFSCPCPSVRAACYTLWLSQLRALTPQSQEARCCYLSWLGGCWGQSVRCAPDAGGHRRGPLLNPPFYCLESSPFPCTSRVQLEKEK